MPILLEAGGCPAYYPTCLLLDLRTKNAAWRTMEVLANDLLHLEHILIFAGITGIERRMEDGRYLDSSEVHIIADLCGVSLARLRKLSELKVAPASLDQAFAQEHAVTNIVKHRRITNIARYLDLIARVGEAHVLAPGIRREPVMQREAMLDNLRQLRPRFRHSRGRRTVEYQDLARVIEFIMIGDPEAIWSKAEIRSRNWAIVTTLALLGLRQGELRQLKTSDVNTNVGRLTVARRSDDQEDPRLREPNAKISDRIVPLLDVVSERIEDYLYNHQSHAAEFSGSTFLFLSHGPTSRGQPTPASCGHPLK
ncbi:site-specific integrase [Paracoccus ravus]|uniref:site-specific integrase n=1 Tax=Paracoccus ravus TaxID=2447760 RepID=UPI00143226C4|nr:site-specific integrase [Paracoccus ravus]